MEKIEKYSVFRCEIDGYVRVMRNVEPRFTVRYEPDDELTNIVFEDFKDEIKPDAIRVAKLMRGVGEEIARFLKNEKRD